METTNKKIILSLENLKKYFVNQGFINKAVDDVSFDVHEGEIVGLIGESGSGKTTVGRSLLRLYDDYNGFVRLDGKIISGKYISNARRKFLRKNVQMIFQDPHASLNGQQPIYSILKEPLMVNGIMSEKIKDIFSDWEDVKNSFKYTFQINAMALESQNYREITKIARPFFEKWTKKLSMFDFDRSLSNEDNFTSFFGYLEEKQNMESIIINNMYSNTNKLLDLYYECQAKYRNKDLSLPEINFIKAKDKLEKAKVLITYSEEAYNAKILLKKLSKQYKAFIQNHKDFKNEAISTFVNYIKEYKNEQMMANISRLMSTDLDYYLYNYKNELLYKKRIEVLRKIYKECKYLEISQIKDLINKLNNYCGDFYNKYLSELKYKKDIKKNIKETINKNFEFNDYESFIKMSNDMRKSFELTNANLLEHINNTNQIIARGAKDAKDIELLHSSLAEFKEAENKYIENMNEFLRSYKSKIEKYYNELKEQRENYKELVGYQTICNKKYEQIKKSYWEYLRRQITNEKSKKSIESLISIYKSDLAIKEDTIKSFSIERKYLNKDLANLHLLLGIDNKWVELNLNPDKNLSSSDSIDVKSTKWKERKNIWSYKLFHPLAKYRISQLLYKTIIYKALEDVGLLKQFAYRYPHEFSGGQLQRIVIARALITEPRVVVADEPIASLDISIQAQIVNLLKELCQKKNIGLIFIAHDLSMVEYVADNIQIMHLGKIVEFGKTEAIFENPIHPYTINLFKAIPKISNSNEKFQNVSFELDYLEAQKFPNVAEVFNVGEHHYIYGTKEQVKEWTTPKLDRDNNLTVEEYTLIETNDVKPKKTYKKTSKQH